MSAPAGWLPDARAVGFIPEAGGDQHHRIGMTLTSAGAWATFSRPTFDAAGESADRQMGSPGLWRRFAAGLAEFDFPSQDLLGGDVKFEQLVDWALATADGRVPRGWSAPPESEILAAVGSAKLLARAGTMVVRGEVLRSEHRLSIAYSQFLRLPDELGDARRAWIAALCEGAQRRWRLVRIGPVAGGSALGAEVDLTGAPPAAVDALVALGVASLTTVLKWALPALCMVADPSVTSEILDSHPLAGVARGDTTHSRALLAERTD